MKVTVQIDMVRDITAEELIDAFAGVPGDAKIKVVTHDGGRFMLDSHTLEASWEIKKGGAVFNG